MITGLSQGARPFGDQAYEPDFSVRIENAPLAGPVLKTVTAVSVSQAANQPAAFAISVNDPDFRLIDAVQGLFSEGKRLEILMGYHGSLQSMIVGEITAVGAELDESGGLTLHVEGYDRLHAGTRGTGYREFRDEQTDSAIVQEIARDMGLNASVDPTDQRLGRRIQNHASNLRYLQALAEDNGYQLWADGDTLWFKRQRPGSRVTVARGRDLLTFSSRLSTAGQVSAVEVRGWDAGREQAFSARAVASQSPGYSTKLSATGKAQISGSGAASERVIYADGRVRTIAEAQTLAHAELGKHQRNLLTAEGSTIGNPAIRVGTILTLENMGRFSGQYVVETARHDIGQAGYRTGFEMRQDL